MLGQKEQQRRLLEERFQSAFNDPLVVREISLTGFHLGREQFFLYLKQSEKFKEPLG